jgi:RNA polymerase sigma-70 factor (ECF subfamily)
LSEPPPHLAEASWDWARLHHDCAREVRRIVWNEHDAEEAVQEALARAWRRRSSCRSVVDPAPWIAQIARREAYRVLARRRLRQGREGAEISTLDDVATDDPRDEERVVERLAVRQALRGLSLDERELIGARYVLDLSQPKVAELLGLPEGTAKVRLHRIRGRLRGLLDPAA